MTDEQPRTAPLGDSVDLLQEAEQTRAWWVRRKWVFLVYPALVAVSLLAGGARSTLWFVLAFTPPLAMRLWLPDSQSARHVSARRLVFVRRVSIAYLTIAIPLALGLGIGVFFVSDRIADWLWSAALGLALSVLLAFASGRGRIRHAG